MKTGRYNIAVGFFTLVTFMAYGFLLIYLRDFAPGKEEWIAQYSIGKHFESRLAHAHGNLFALMNVALGLVLSRLQGADSLRKTTAILGLLGLLMPLGILMEVYLGTSPVFVLLGGASMVGAMALGGWLALKSPPENNSSI